MKTIKIIFDNGKVMTTSINGSVEEILNYYVGKTFRFGRTDEIALKAVRVEFV